MLKETKNQSGQAMVIIALGLIVLIGFTALAIDGGRVLLEQRNVQNAADNGAFAAALAICNSESEAVIISRAEAAVNLAGYDNADPNQTVTVTVSGDTADVQVSSTIQGSFVGLIYDGPLGANENSMAQCSLGAGANEGWPEIPFSVYGGDSSCEKDPVQFSGNLNIIRGPVHSNGDWRVNGNDNTFEDLVTYAGTNNQTEGGNNFPGGGPTDNDTVYTPWPLTADPFIVANYRPGGLYSSDPNYHSSSNDMDLSGSLHGIYYSAKKITLSDADISGSVTLVAEDEVGLSGNDHNLTPYINNILIISTHGDKCDVAAAKFSGNGHFWSGIVYVPNGMIDMSGNMNTSSFDGCLWGARVNFAGEGMQVANCAAYLNPTKAINLIE